MHRRRLRLLSTSLLVLVSPGITGRAVMTGRAAAQTVGSPNQALTANPADLTKELVERNIKRVVASRSLAAPAAGGFTNPRVAPGLVRWHDSFAAACEAARRSGRPVLLFQMMGKLDEQFC
jgi:hypothetical protein